ncbi:hypothetical protein OUZ56_031560 [Daphnia magna]|uniref:Uncharacterized protein n=1 Tax=Daphnia magna TaxID=35525 RepID=A0ABQ9ZVD6_9CRUS|nr:hypothetical protein OUZ56_031560 [Daphnia magna]
MTAIQKNRFINKAKFAFAKSSNSEQVESRNGVVGDEHSTTKSIVLSATRVSGNAIKRSRAFYLASPNNDKRHCQTQQLLLDRSCRPLRRASIVD